MLRRRSIPHSALLVPALGLFFAVLFAAQNAYRGVVFHLGPPLGSVVTESLTRWLLYAALAPAVGWLVQHLPIERGRLRLSLPANVLAAVAFAVVHAVLMGFVYRILHVYPRQDSLLEAIRRLLMTYFGVNFVVFWAISGAYHAIRYHEETRHRERLAAELRTRLTEARLQALRSQLNPHFLFNTLNAISVLALTGEREHVVQTLSSLSELLRVALDRDLPQEISLARELEILDRYVEIQRVRFGDRLTFTLDAPAEATAALVPSMVLQPLVENALQHGIGARPGPGSVAVRARRDADTLFIAVEDTGPGFAPMGNGDGRGPGIGLANTRARLEALYGDDDRLSCVTAYDGGACVQLRLPYRAAAPEARA